MDCCSVETSTDSCPSCGERGRPVEPITPASLVDPARDFTVEAWRFCRHRPCPIAYFSEGGATVDASEVRVPIFQKETSIDRPVCYCFGFDVRALRQDEAGAIPAEIKERCRRGEDRCPELNPQGACCLGNVLAIARNAEVPA